jgi:hypothetical protein
MFPTDEWDAAERMLEEECSDNLPALADATPATLDRIRFAALRLGGGQLGSLREAIQMGQTDWRDLLVAAGFGDLHAHEQWQPRVLLPKMVDLWTEGVQPDGVDFRRGDRVRITGPGQGGIGAIVSLLALEPEPRYVVELSSGSNVLIYQRWLTHIS